MPLAERSSVPSYARPVLERLGTFRELTLATPPFLVPSSCVLVSRDPSSTVYHCAGRLDPLAARS